MAKVARHVELEEAHIAAIQSAFGGSVKLSYILNEMLFHFHNILHEREVNIQEMFKEAAERSQETLDP
jgi:phosphoribosyl-ATP pyrophosphohydrolase